MEVQNPRFFPGGLAPWTPANALCVSLRDTPEAPLYYVTDLFEIHKKTLLFSDNRGPNTKVWGQRRGLCSEEVVGDPKKQEKTEFL